MPLTIAIILNVVLDIALLAGLAFHMSHAAKLTPHDQPGLVVPDRHAEYTWETDRRTASTWERSHAQ
jgi:hypothetical protein